MRDFWRRLIVLIHLSLIDIPKSPILDFYKICLVAPEMEVEKPCRMVVWQGFWSPLTATLTATQPDAGAPTIFSWGLRRPSVVSGRLQRGVGRQGPQTLGARC